MLKQIGSTLDVSINSNKAKIVKVASSFIEITRNAIRDSTVRCIGAQGANDVEDIADLESELCDFVQKIDSVKFSNAVAQAPNTNKEWDAFKNIFKRTMKYLSLEIKNNDLL